MLEELQNNNNNAPDSNHYRRLLEGMAVAVATKGYAETTIADIVREASVSFNQMVIGLRQKKALETFVPEGTRQEVEASGGAVVCELEADSG